jgi:hypothetical protein
MWQSTQYTLEWVVVRCVTASGCITLWQVPPQKASLCITSRPLKVAVDTIIRFTIVSTTTSTAMERSRASLSPPRCAGHLHSG